MTTIAKPGALKEYHPLRDTLIQAADALIAAKAENARLRQLADGLSESGGWFTNSAGLLGLGFVAGIAVTMALVIGAAWVQA